MDGGVLVAVPGLLLSPAPWAMLHLATSGSNFLAAAVGQLRSTPRLSRSLKGRSSEAQGSSGSP